MRSQYRPGGPVLSSGRSRVLLLAAAVALVLGLAGSAWCQDGGPDSPPDPNQDDATIKPDAADQSRSLIDQARDRAAADSLAAQVLPPGATVSFRFEPKAGVKANVRQYTYFADWTTSAKFRRDAAATKTLNWSWDQYRKQEKTVENRKGGLDYNFGRQLPMIATLSANWNWSEDRTTNTAGYANLYKVDNKLVTFNASKSKFMGWGLLHSAKAGASYTDQASLNQNQRNDFREGNANGNFQTGWALGRGVIVAGRVGGSTTAGTRLLAAQSSPSSAYGDSLGVGVYVNRGIGKGFIQLTRANFEKKYLEFRRNANGLIDTVGIPDAQKVLNELETRDALTLDLEHSFYLAGVTGITKASHTTDDVNYATGVAGLKQRAADNVEMTLAYNAGRDSVAVVYKYGLRWDDQRIRAATSSRGRQYTQERDFQANWYRTLFAATRLTFQYHEGLTQEIAENRFNENDKDRVQRDVAGRLERAWTGLFRSTMVFSWRQTQDISIRGGSSSNNNVKDFYEITPGYTWNLAPWFTLDQNYRVSIQYTDYLYSYLPTVTRNDDYNKRGDLTTKVTFVPNDRVTITVRHDFNRRFNATKTSEDAAGDAFYRRDLEQDISKIDLDLKYVAAPGVTLEASTYRTRDDRTSLGRTTTETRTDSAELVVGGRVDQSWGARKQAAVSAVIRKINAYGPSITATSSDYWEADVWLKWMF